MAILMQGYQDSRMDDVFTKLWSSGERSSLPGYGQELLGFRTNTGLDETPIDKEYTPLSQMEPILFLASQ